jgi:hypothetical protein
MKGAREGARRLFARLPFECGEPDLKSFRGGTMLTRLAVAAALIVTAVAPKPAAAQYRVGYGWRSGSPPTEPTITPYFGYMNMGRYDDGPLGQSVGGGDAGLVGAQLTLPLSPFVALVGNVGHANSNMVFIDPVTGGPSMGTTGAWIFDGDLQLSSPFRGSGGHWIEPFVQLGAGAMRYSTEYSTGDASSTNFAFNGGIGLNYEITRRIGFQLLAKDYVGHWDTQPQFPFDSGDRFTNNYAITAGLNVGLGR